MHFIVPGGKRGIGFALTIIIALLAGGVFAQATVAAKPRIETIKSLKQKQKLGPLEAVDSVATVLDLKNAQNEIGKGKKINSYHYRFRLGGTTIDVVKPQPLCIVGDGIVIRCVYFTNVVIYGDRRLE